MNEELAYAEIERHRVSAEIQNDRRVIRRLGRVLAKKHRLLKNGIQNTIDELSFWQHNRARASQYARAYHLVKMFLKNRPYQTVEVTRRTDVPKFVLSSAVHGTLSPDASIEFYSWYASRPPLIGIGHNTITPE